MNKSEQMCTQTMHNTSMGAYYCLTQGPVVEMESAVMSATAGVVLCSFASVCCQDPQCHSAFGIHQLRTALHDMSVLGATSTTCKPTSIFQNRDGQMCVSELFPGFTGICLYICLRIWEDTCPIAQFNPLPGTYGSPDPDRS